MKTLDMLSAGDQARISSVAGDDSVAVRLMEMGIVEGEEIEHLGAAPLGDPVEIKVRGYHLTLRKHEAEQILVRAKS